MKRTATALLTAIALSSITAVTAAQDQGARAVPAADVSYTFEDHAVDGGRYEPDGTIIDGHRRRARHSLIRPRVHFVAELTTSVERI